MKKIIFLFALLHPALKVIAQDSLFYQSVEWSPDSKKICTEVIRKSGNNFSYEGYIINIDNSNIDKKIDGAFFPAWSPGGKLIAYTKRNETRRGADILLLNIETGNIKKINSDSSRTSGVTFSPDGKRICFSSDRNPKRNLYIIDIDGKNLERITFDTVGYFNPEWSPKGNKILYYRERGDQRDKVYTIDLTDKKETRITDDSLHNIYPGWLPDGKTIIYASVDLSLPLGDRSQATLIDADGQHRQLVPNTDGAFFSRVSPDGKKLAFIKGGWPTSHIYIANIDGSDIACLTCTIKTQ